MGDGEGNGAGVAAAWGDGEAPDVSGSVPPPQATRKSVASGSAALTDFNAVLISVAFRKFGLP
jgi:hypothetical protein